MENPFLALKTDQPKAYDCLCRLTLLSFSNEGYSLVSLLEAAFSNNQTIAQVTECVEASLANVAGLYPGLSPVPLPTLKVAALSSHAGYFGGSAFQNALRAQNLNFEMNAVFDYVSSPVWTQNYPHLIKFCPEKNGLHVPTLKGLANFIEHDLNPLFLNSYRALQINGLIIIALALICLMICYHSMVNGAFYANLLLIPVIIAITLIIVATKSRYRDHLDCRQSFNAAKAVKKDMKILLQRIHRTSKGNTDNAHAIQLLESILKQLSDSDSPNLQLYHTMVVNFMNTQRIAPVAHQKSARK